MPQAPDMNSLTLAPALRKVIGEAEDIARATGQRASSAHLLLAFFTTKNHGERLLRARNIDEDRLLENIKPEAIEPKTAVRQIMERAAQVAAGCGTREVDCLHVVVGMTRVRDSQAFQLLNSTGEKVGSLRTRALTILTGAMPRWLSHKNYQESILPSQIHIQSARPHLSQHYQPSRIPRPDRDHLSSRGPVISWKPPILPPSAHGVARRDPPPERALPEPQNLLPPEPESMSEVLPPPGYQPSDMPVSEQSMVPEEIESPNAWALPETDFPWLTSLGRNLSVEASEGRLDKLVGRESEVKQLIDIIGKRRSNNPCLVGEAGVGKTAVVEGLAAALQRGSGPDQQKIIIALDVGALLVGTHLRGSFSEKLQGLKDEVKLAEGKVAIFFDELHTLVGAGSAGEGPLDAANELKTALARGDFPCIGATTFDEYKKHIEADPALKRRFVPVLVKEPAPKDAISMLQRIIPAYAEHHGVNYQKDSIEAAVKLSSRFITDRYLPDKAIALLDLAGSRAARGSRRKVDKRDIAELIAERTGLPVERLLASDRQRLLKLEELLCEEVVGHKRALCRIAEVIRRNAAGFNSQRPQGAFLIVGPTGVGKTETAKALSRLLHGSEEAMIRFDLSEFGEAHTVSRLVGAPPGYVGHDAGGQLTEAVRRRPGRVLLLDEIEKAHRDVLQILLQILDEGRLTDGHGRTVSFAETIVIMTSNLGADLSKARRRIGFDESTPEQSQIDLEKQILQKAREKLSPELWGRIQERLVFTALQSEEIKQIAQLLASASSKRLETERGISFELDDSALEFLIGQGGYDLSLGARPMRHLLARMIEAPIAARILEGRLHADEHVTIKTRPEGGLMFVVGNDGLSLTQRPMKTH